MLRVLTYNSILLSSCLCHLLVKQVVEDRDAGFHSLKDNITGVGKVSKLMIKYDLVLFGSCSMCDVTGSSFNNKAETIPLKRQVSFSLSCFPVM